MTPTHTIPPTAQPGDFDLVRMSVGIAAGPVAAGQFGVKPPGASSDIGLDLAIANSAAPDLTLLHGDGAGGFTAAHTLTVTGSSGGFSDLQVADLNRDGHLDLIASQPGGDRIVVALGDGREGLRAAPSSPAGSTPGRLAIAEVTGDGIPDVLVADDADIRVLRGIGDGSFALAGRVALGARAADLLVHDVTGDQRADLIVALPGQNLVRVYAGNGAAQFTALTAVTSNAPTALALGDMTGDGRADLVVANRGDQTLTLWRGTALGFDPPHTVLNGFTATRLIRTDVDGDGRADLLAFDAVGGRVRVLLGNGNGTFELATTLTIGQTSVAGLALGDFNGDRLPDFVVTVPSSQEIVIGLNRAPVRRQPGDLNRDSTLSTADARQLLAEIYDGDGADALSSAGGDIVSGAEADVNADGAISAGDLTDLLRRLHR